MDVYSRTVERETPIVDVSQQYRDQVSVHYSDGHVHMIMTKGEALELAVRILDALGVQYAIDPPGGAVYDALEMGLSR